MYYDIIIKLLYNIFYQIQYYKKKQRELLYMQVSKRKYFLAKIGMLCNVNEYNDTDCNFDNANGFYIFSLLHHILLVYKDHDFKLTHDYVSA